LKFFEFVQEIINETLKNKENMYCDLSI